MDFCTTTTTTATQISLQDLITAPARAESLLELLTPDQISAIEQTLVKVKKRRLDNKEDATTTTSNNETEPINTLLNFVAVSVPATADPPQTIDSTSQITPSVPTTTATTTTTTTPLSNTTSQNVKPTAANTVNTTPNEPVTEVRDGIEWVSFVYSHNRALKRYSIRTDLSQVDTSLIDDKFKSENCVYPRANLPKEEYHGNRWAYETECNVLGWKLAWLNKEEIAGKRGLIQRAVDSYRNRYPSMRSRRVARQEKLLNGTLRKRKHREGEEQEDGTTIIGGNQHVATTVATGTTTHHPKTIAIEDTVNNQRFRIKINVESVDLDEINIEFRKANCPFPRVMAMTQPPINNNARWLEETMCNELAWKLAWLNPRHLAGKKNMLQRALDIYRSKFMPSLQPRKNSNRVAPIPPPSTTTTLSPQASLIDLLPSLVAASQQVPLTADALSAQNALYEKTNPPMIGSPAMSNMSGTTVSLDFADCFSLADEESSGNSNNKDELSAAAAVFCNLLLQQQQQQDTVMFDNQQQQQVYSTTSSYSSDSTACTPSPSTLTNDDPFTTDFFDQFMMPTIDDPFYMMDITTTTTNNNDHSTTAADLSKLYNTTIEQQQQQQQNTLFSLDPLF